MKNILMIITVLFLTSCEDSHEITFKGNTLAQTVGTDPFTQTTPTPAPTPTLTPTPVPSTPTANLEFPLKIEFNDLSYGDDVSSLFSYWGTFNGSYGTTGDDYFYKDGYNSSLLISIEKGQTGRPGDGQQSNSGDFGFIKNIENDLSIGEDQELWLSFFIYIPEDFSFKTNNSTGLKFVRHGVSGAGGAKIDFLATHDAQTGEQTGWNLLNENTHVFEEQSSRKTKGILKKGHWNFYTQYIRASSTTAGSIMRLWVNDEFVMEHKGQSNNTVLTKWVDPQGTLKNESWSPNSNWRTLANSSSKIVSTFLFTYWNGGAPKDQSLNIQSIYWHNDSSVLPADKYGNKYIHSNQ